MSFHNPFKPGAGHMPPYLAGRTAERQRFVQLLGQSGSITENLVLTGLRGVGKTVLLETFKPAARASNWLWTGTDMSEAASLTEANLATRIITDLSIISASTLTHTSRRLPIGFDRPEETMIAPVGYAALKDAYENAPGLVIDKIKFVMLLVWRNIEHSCSGVVFAYDEAQIMGDGAASQEYPLSLMLELFQSLQRQGARYFLVLTGLPTLFPKLVEARTYSERMFHVMMLDQLNDSESRDAIMKPIEDQNCSVTFTEKTVQMVLKLSGGYPYFIQFICKEIFDVALAKVAADEPLIVPEDAIVSKLDNDFFAARWEKATDRERDLLRVIAGLPNCDDEFSVNEIVSLSATRLEKGFSSSHVNQMLNRMQDKGLIFKNRHGKYSFAVPLLSRFIRRQDIRLRDTDLLL